MSELQLVEAGPVTLPITDIKRDPELQCRANGVSVGTVRMYAEAMTQGARFPAVTVFRDGKGVCLLADGWHRIAAAELNGATEIEVEIREGSRKDALLFAAGANSAHGLQRSPADKRAAVAKLLAEPTWAKRADNWIAKHANVSHTFVAKIRSTCHDSSDGPRETADGRVMEVTNIGGKVALTSEANLERVLQKFTKLLGEVAEANRATFADKVMEVLAAEGRTS